MRVLVQLLASLLVIAVAPAEEFTAEDRAWWAVQPVADPAVPDGAEHAVDAFVNRQLAGADLAPGPEASAEEFVRRAYFDLHGLPPTAPQVAAFSKAHAVDPDTAIGALVDELLASPRYGERWAQHWLDVVRYAESDGYREDRFRPGAHRYRDYVIRAFNGDKPYDQFVREQLAADEFAPHDPGIVEATGFLRLGIYEWNQRNAEMQRELMVNEITNITGEVFLGLGLGCARCHDHKFDPLLQKDYFALQAFLSSTAWPTDQKLGTAEELRKHADWQTSTAELRAEIDALLEPARKKVGETHVRTFPENVQAMYRKPQAERSSYEEQISMLVQRQVDREHEKVKPLAVLAKDAEKLARYKELAASLKAAEKQRPRLSAAFVSRDTGDRPAITYIDHRQDQPRVEPGFPELLGLPAPEIPAVAGSTGRRTALANWIASTENPLAARVFVNRLWQYHFGRGLVATPNDFGTLGEPPSHPELLDWLASRFVEQGWRSKPMHRLIMTSAAYRRSARHEPGQAEQQIDPENRLLWRFTPQRLSAEQARDAMLAVSGELKHRVGGGSVGGDSPARSIYVKKLRNTPDAVLQSFDSPSGFDSAPTRTQTNTATQALLLANNPWPAARAKAFALRLLKGKKAFDRDMVASAYQDAWGRPATEKELSQAMDFLAQQVGETRWVTGPPDRFPNETGLRPIAQRFGAAEGIALGEKALWLQPGSRFERLQIENITPLDDTFTLEAVICLEAIHKDAKVNPIIAHWNGDTKRGGWSFGVTSAASLFQPRNLVVELTGNDLAGSVHWEAVASGLRVPLGKPVYVAASVRLDEKGQGKVFFYLKDLSDPKAVLQTAEVGHTIIGGIHPPMRELLIGGREQAGHLFDGQIAAVSIAVGKLNADQLLVQPAPAPAGRLLHWTFSGENDESPAPQTRWKRSGPPPPTHGIPLPVLAAMTDFCHALLCSNEFLYLH